MRPSSQAQHLVCFPCFLRISQGALPSSISNAPTSKIINLATNGLLHRDESKPSTLGKPAFGSRLRFPRNRPQARCFSSLRCLASNPTATEPNHETPPQSQPISQIRRLKRKLRSGIANIPINSTEAKGVSLETVLRAIQQKNDSDSVDGKVIEAVGQVYAGKTPSDVTNDLEKLTSKKAWKNTDKISQEGREVLSKLGLTKDEKEESERKNLSGKAGRVMSARERRKRRRERKAERASKSAQRHSGLKSAPRKRIRRIPTGSRKPEDVQKGKRSSKPEQEHEEMTLINLTPKQLESLIEVDSSLLNHSAVETETVQKIPRLSFDLARVLFNPGVYQLQDPRSRVYNFDPYLQHLIPIEQFNFEALNKYMTSSEDETLRGIATNRCKKYIGSSSSMTGVLSHFHYLLSAWRPLSINTMSRQFRDQTKSFTQISRGPSAVFLRWKNNSYAVDADKEYDSSNILMNMGKALEKLLTLEKDEFERYRRSPNQVSAELIDAEPEAFHYSELDDFLMRSQLDAFDPRLPGNGTFDLKTRAVAGVRMNMGEYEVGKGYQIKNLLGTWESYEREYFDMMRSAFLKYSLQVRMGRMDGIFVAFHNIARMFGFQYIPISELDTALHGQSNPNLGDREFRLSIRLMNEIFNMSTKEFPEKSIRFHFETRPESKGDPRGAMLVFAEPMTEDEIQIIQDTGKAKAAEMERKLLHPQSSPPSKSESGSESSPAAIDQDAAQTLTQADRGKEKPEVAISSSSTQESSAADTSFLDQICRDEVSAGAIRKELAAWKLTVYNEVNGKTVVRPQNLQESDQWRIKYKFEKLTDDNGWVKYQSCKNRRRATLDWPTERPDSYFLNQIRELNQKGAEWRKEQDELEIGREKIVLYEYGA